jgi:hypothetical protein
MRLSFLPHTYHIVSLSRRATNSSVVIDSWCLRHRELAVMRVLFPSVCLGHSVMHLAIPLHQTSGSSDATFLRVTPRGVHSCGRSRRPSHWSLNTVGLRVKGVVLQVSARILPVKFLGIFCL